MAWVPSHMRHSSPEMYTTKLGEKNVTDPISIVKALLNKLTEEKFLAISLEMKDLFKKSINTPELQTKVATSIVTKAIREPNYSKLYTELILSIIDENPEFRVSLIRFLQGIFVKLCEHRDAHNRAKRLTGCATLIAEFYNHKLISQKIFFCNVANYFLEELSDDTLGALCVLIVVSRDCLNESSSGKESLNLYIKRIKEIRHNETNGISSRMRFLLLDVVEARK